MKCHFGTWCVLIAFSVLGTEPIPEHLEGVELYDWLGVEGIWEAALEDETVLELISDGVFHDDSDISYAAIGAIGLYTGRVEMESWVQTGAEFPHYNIQDIPELKDFLLEVWDRESNANPHFKTEAYFAELLDIRNDRMVSRLDRVWIQIPGMLATIFPKDPDVLKVLWDAMLPNQYGQMLRNLDVGEFNTEEAIDFRVRCLMDTEMADTTVARAARGLGRFQSKKGFDALLRRLNDTENRTSAIAHIIEAIVMYGEEAVPHADRLRSVASLYNLRTEDGVQLSKPNGYNTTHLIGMKYRTHLALDALQKLEDSRQEAVEKHSVPDQ